MCRSIKRLREGTNVASEDEVRAAARQFVRKVSGFQHPSQRHAAAFEQAVDEVTRAATTLLGSVVREMEAPARAGAA